MFHKGKKIYKTTQKPLCLGHNLLFFLVFIGVHHQHIACLDNRISLRNDYLVTTLNHYHQRLAGNVKLTEGSADPFVFVFDGDFGEVNRQVGLRKAIHLLPFEGRREVVRDAVRDVEALLRVEAVHLGAWMAGRTEAEVLDALTIVSVSPTFRDPGWLTHAFEVMEKYPCDPQFHSLGIPTWFYGHEPATPFATDIAKFFDNSIRENYIISVPKGGIIYTPGSAGTFQEIFQDAAQNHYETLGYASPMVFLGTHYYTEDTPIYPLLVDLQERGKYKNLILQITDNTDDVVRYLMDFHRPYKEWTGDEA